MEPSHNLTPGEKFLRHYRGSNSRPHDQESNALPTEPTRTTICTRRTVYERAEKNDRLLPFAPSGSVTPRRLVRPRRSEAPWSNTLGGPAILPAWARRVRPVTSFSARRMGPQVGLVGPAIPPAVVTKERRKRPGTSFAPSRLRVSKSFLHSKNLTCKATSSKTRLTPMK